MKRVFIVMVQRGRGDSPESVWYNEEDADKEAYRLDIEESEVAWVESIFLYGEEK